MRLDPGEALRKTRGSVALAAGGGALTPWHSIDWERGSNTNWAGVSRSAPEASHARRQRACKQQLRCRGDSRPAMLGSRGLSGRMSLPAVLSALAAAAATNTTTTSTPFPVFSSGHPPSVIEYRIPILVSLGDGQTMLAFAVRGPVLAHFLLPLNSALQKN